MAMTESLLSAEHPEQFQKYEPSSQGRNSKAYSAEIKDIHTAHYVSLMHPTTTQSTLKQPRPATRMDTTLQGTCFMDNRVVFKFKIRLKTLLY